MTFNHKLVVRDAGSDLITTQQFQHFTSTLWGSDRSAMRFFLRARDRLYFKIYLHIQ